MFDHLLIQGAFVMPAYDPTSVNQECCWCGGHAPIYSGFAFWIRHHGQIRVAELFEPLQGIFPPVFPVVANHAYPLAECKVRQYGLFGGAGGTPAAPDMQQVGAPAKSVLLICSDGSCSSGSEKFGAGFPSSADWSDALSQERINVKVSSAIRISTPMTPVRSSGVGKRRGESDMR